MAVALSPLQGWAALGRFPSVETLGFCLFALQAGEMSANTEQRKQAAVMFTDMVGYSALIQQVETILPDSVDWARHSSQPARHRLTSRHQEFYALMHENDFDFG